MVTFIAAIVGVTTSVATAWADSIQAGCSSSSCTWGYNYVGPGRLIYTPTSNFYSASDSINSGGYEYLGFGGSQANCYSFATVGYTHYAPVNFGCTSSNNTGFTQYASGSSSYLQFQAAYN
jgi:hypothetical protein